MKFWAVEFGTFWLSDAANGLPPESLSRIETTFVELSISDLEGLQAAMNQPDPELIRDRFQSGRRCFALKTPDRIVAYGWATRGLEKVGELEREFHLREDEVYIWDCGTVPALRGKRCYSALLNQMIYRFHNEGIPRIWIGASRQNQPSIKGIVYAGFHHVVDMVYRRLWRITFLRFDESHTASRSQVDAAYRILVGQNEKRLGPFAFGIYRDGIL